uniref:Uncharacterized protein n=1 Tax=Ficedula albicollis TaxID=59894 RepID=A0A803VMK7_FICAL
PTFASCTPVTAPRARGSHPSTRRTAIAHLTLSTSLAAEWQNKVRNKAAGTAITHLTLSTSLAAECALCTSSAACMGHTWLQSDMKDSALS